MPTIPSIPLTENVTVHFIDVGQGDSIFVDTPALDMLIDGGPRSAGQKVIGYLQTLNVTRIDFVVATHPHADHIGGLITVLEEYRIFQIPVVIQSGDEATTVTYQDYIASLGSRTVQVAVRGSIIVLDEGVNITILNPTSPLEFDEANDNSIVMMLRVYNVTFLFTGDSESPSEASIVMAGLGQSGTILKVGHHGSRTSTSSEYLEVVDPEVAVISVGEGNRYGHPHQETLNELENEGVTIYRTDYHGSIEITTDGVDYSVETETVELEPEPVPTPLLPPIFTDLSITPEEIEPGTEVSISFTITNSNSQSFTYTATMQIGELNLLIDVELGAYESKTVSRTITQYMPGVYNATVDGMTGSFTVAHAPLPAEFVISDLEASPEFGFDIPFEPGEYVVLSVLVKNIGETEGTFIVEIKVDGETIDTQNVTLAPGRGRHARAYFEPMNPGTYQVSVEDLTENFIVSVPLEPAEFEFSNLRIFYPGVTPPEVESGQTVTVTVSIEVENVGDLDGGRTVELKVDGEVVNSKEVTLGGGASDTVLFELTRGEGTYEVEVEGFTESFTVDTKPEPRGIPGFPYISFILGLLIALVFHRRNQS